MKKRKEHKCLRCCHKWFRRLRSYPLICPKCKTPYWDRIKRSIKKDAEINIKEESIRNMIK